MAYCEVCDRWNGSHHPSCPILLAIQLSATPVGDGIPLLSFGKHRNRLISEVLEEDPSYLVWAFETVAEHGGIDRGSYLDALRRTQYRSGAGYDGGPDDYEDREEGIDYPFSERDWGDLD